MVLCKTCLFQVEGVFYVNDFLEKLMFEELKHHSASQGNCSWVKNGTNSKCLCE